MKKFILLLLLIVSFTPISNAQTFSEIIKATASDAAINDGFGYNILVSGDYAIVGTPNDADNGFDSGSAYILKKDQGGTDNWGQLQKITASDGAAYDYFGVSVSVSGDYAIVAAHADDDNGGESGSAYIFKKDQGGTDNWGQVKKITASDAAAGDLFGISVSISGDYVIVGAFQDDDNGGESGSAYIFKKDQGGTDNWGQLQKITASDAAANDKFGNSISVSGDYVIVGAFQDDDNGGNSGSAYIFKKDQGGTDNWGQLQKITASDAAANDKFGNSISVSGDYVIVGANGDESSSGSAYIFKEDQGGTDNWGQLQKITASDAAANDYFGQSVSVSGDYVIVGANQDDDNSSNSGSAYIFKKDQGGTDNWGQLQKITASDAAADDDFGWSVSVSGDYVIVGARYDDDNGSSSGSTYIFKSSVVLPVELSYFKGENTTAGNLLTWQTASEENNEGFDIQRSADGENWETIYFAAGNGTTLETQNYTFTDDAPLSGVNYYRLKQVDFDGQFEYSNIVNIQTIESSNHQNINIYPNPVTDELTIENGQGTAIIYNAVGQSVQEVNIDASKIQLTVSELPQGIYTIHIRKTNGESITKQFVK
ncbi:MAG: hypothetical protein ACI9XO_004756 [Paraglaciecola sp.]|jgi:hypothetical protein